MRTEESDGLKQRAAHVIPNGMYGHMSVQMQSPRTPQFFSKAQGAYLWDYDGNRFIDFLCAFGPNLLGYHHEEIDAAFLEQLNQVDTATAPSAVMIDLAEAYVDQITHADWVMTCKNGTDATTMAMMTARAYTGKKKILRAKGAYHGAAPWCTPLPAGTLEGEREHFIYYQYNDVDSLQAAIDDAGDDLAGIFAAPFKHDFMTEQELPNADYAQAARDLCDEKDALLIVDDVRAGFRMARDCSWHAIGVEPDLSTWGKSLANGHPLSCFMGNEKARNAAGSLYVTGSFWYAAAPMAAALKTLEVINNTDYLERSIQLGDRLRTGLYSIAQESSLPLHQSGPSQMPLIMIMDQDGKVDGKRCVAFCDQLLDHGVLFHPFHNMFITSAMTEQDIDHALQAASRVARSV